MEHSLLPWPGKTTQKVWTRAGPGDMIEVKSHGNVALDDDGWMFNNR